MKMLIKIDMSNAAFDVDSPLLECARILQELVNKIESGETIPSYLRDINGNRTGAVVITQ